MSELMQLLIGISISRYFPARGTAGLARIFVSGYRRVPAPPPRMMAKTRFMPLSQIGVAARTYRSFWLRNRLWEESVEITGIQIATESLKSSRSFQIEQSFDNSEGLLAILTGLGSPQLGHRRVEDFVDNSFAQRFDNLAFPG